MDMSNLNPESGAVERSRLVERGQRLEYFTIFWNSLEALAALISGFIAGSVALVAFGLDSLIEVTSGAALLWRLHQDKNTLRREAAERLTLRIVGSCFLMLSAYIAYDSLTALLRREAPARSLPGIVIAVASLVAMPLLSRAKRRVGVGLGSAAMAADARQADFCTHLSAILLSGLLLNALFGLWWADPVAGLVMVPIIAREGIAGWQGKACCDTCVD
jgi:divalent metal cation (Fe/Co/Zn/Cd) transporter